MNLLELFAEILHLEDIFRQLETRKTRGITKLVNKGFKSLERAREALEEEFE